VYLIFCYFLLLVFTLIPANAVVTEIYISDIFYDTFILDALSDLSIQSGVPIIADDTVSGFITMEFMDIPFEEALYRICIPSGYIFSYMEQGYYLVGSPDPQSSAFQQMAVTEAIKLKHITSEEARDLLPLTYDKFLRSSDHRDIITITAPPEIIARFKADLEIIDTPPQQIRIQALITEVSKDLIQEYGADLFSLLTNEPEGDNTISFQTDRLSLSWYGTHARILASLKALEREHLAEIKADPQIVVIDRGTGNLFIGEEQVIILEPEGTSARIERVQVGVSLEVTPRITADSEIQLELTPKLSHFTEEIDRRIRVRRSEISTTVFTSDGETLMLAGMTVEGQEAREKKVPILGDIPIIRWLFRQVEEKESDKELLIFITPEIIGG